MALYSSVLFLFAILIGSECSNLASNHDEKGKLSCSSTETACLFGCCPVPNAVCCADGFECCPQGSTCIPIIGICVGMNQSNLTLYTQKSESLTAPVVHLSLCPSGMTQCGAGCCPLPSAVCCSDGVHCCPNGYTCDYRAGGCVRNKLLSPFLEKVMY